MKPPVLILGAKSTIALAIAHEFAKQGHSLHLVARSVDGLERDIDDFKVRYRSDAQTHALDLNDYEAYRELLASLSDVRVIISVLGRQEVADRSYTEPDYVREITEGNYTTPILVAEISAEFLADKSEGVFIGISSVAGDRGRQSNYLYGSAKAGYTAYLSGLRNKMAKTHVHVLTVKPGIIRTPLTSKQDFPEALMGEAKTVGADIYKAYQKRRNVIYTPWFWWGIMNVIRHVPEFVFKRLSL